MCVCVGVGVREKACDRCEQVTWFCKEFRNTPAAHVIQVRE